MCYKTNIGTFNGNAKGVTLFENKYPFKVIETDQESDEFRDVLELRKHQYPMCYKFFCTT